MWNNLFMISKGHLKKKKKLQITTFWNNVYVREHSW